MTRLHNANAVNDNDLALMPTITTTRKGATKGIQLEKGHVTPSQGASQPACLPSPLSPFFADSFSLASEINSFRILLVFRTHTALKFYRAGKAHTRRHTHTPSWGCACATLGIGLSSEIFRSIHPAAKRRSLECKQPSTAILRPKVCLDNTALLVRTTPNNPILYSLY